MKDRLEALLEKLADCAGEYDTSPPRCSLRVDEHQLLEPNLTVGDLREARRLLDEMRRAR